MLAIFVLEINLKGDPNEVVHDFWVYAMGTEYENNYRIVPGCSESTYIQRELVFVSTELRDYLDSE